MSSTPPDYYPAPMEAPPTGNAPGIRLLIVLLIAFALTVPLFSVWLLVYDRQSQSETAQNSIASGWGDVQTVSGPLLILPYRRAAPAAAPVPAQTVPAQNGAPATPPPAAAEPEIAHLVLRPERAELQTDLQPEVRSRAIYQAVVYQSRMQGQVRFTLSADLLQRQGIDPATIDFAHAELRFGLSDPRGLGANPRVAVNGRQLGLEPGGGTVATDGRGFFARLDAAQLRESGLDVRFAFEFRGNRSLSLVPQAGDTIWRVSSPWPHPGFQGDFLPTERSVGPDGFSATYQVGNLALGRALIGDEAATIQTADPGRDPVDRAIESEAGAAPNAATATAAQVSLVQPIDAYGQVNRATKYGFLFIGFTFLAFLMFDLIGGVKVSSVEYLLVGAGLILFFVLLLAFAEVIGFMPAYLVASGAITGLITFYSASVLASWRRAVFIALLLTLLYALLYVLLSLEAYSLLIGSITLFVALAAIMYLTRGLNWGAPREVPA